MAGFSGYRTGWRQDARHCWPMRWKAAHDDPDAGGDADLGCLRGYDGLAMLVQEVLKKSPHSGHMFVFRGKRADRIKLLWWDGAGLCKSVTFVLAAGYPTRILCGLAALKSFDHPIWH
jgi:hypothetical protein